VELRELGRSEAAALISRWHYAQGVGQITHAYALHLRSCGSVLGVASYNPPALGAAKLMSAGTGLGHQRVIALTRLAFHPDAPHNTGSALLARSGKALPERWAIITSYADEAQGVVGVVYQASNLTYLGKTAPRPVWTRGGVQVSVKRGGKTLTHEQMREEGCVLAARASMHRYRLLRGHAETQRNPGAYPKPMDRLLS